MQDTDYLPAFAQWSRSEFYDRYGAALEELAAGMVIEATKFAPGGGEIVSVVYVRAFRQQPARTLARSMSRSKFGKRCGRWLDWLAETESCIEIKNGLTSSRLYLTASTELPDDLSPVAHLINPLEPAAELAG